MSQGNLSCPIRCSALPEQPIEATVTHMRTPHALAVLWSALTAVSPSTSAQSAPGPAPSALKYPAARRDDTVDTYFDTKVPAPYQWMENLDSPALQPWIEAEN